MEPHLPLLLSDPAELREALINLIFNAVEALPKGGTITLVTRSIPGENRESERQIQVEVRDNGIGMSEKTRQHCLEPFFSTKDKHGGTGLGLAMVYSMTQHYDGTIEIDSSLGYGTCIRLGFPVRKKTSPIGQDSQPQPQLKQKRSLHILCIDDDAQVGQLLNDCLTHFSHRVMIASGGKQGMELFRAAMLKKQPYEVVITDLGMPDIDGHHVARMIKAESPNTPVIMMTGWDVTMRNDGETAPKVDAVIGKPPHMQELNDLILKVAKPATD